MAGFFEDYLAAWATNDVDAVLGFFTDDIQYEDTTIRHGAKGRDKVARFVQASFDNVPGVHFDYVGHVATDTSYAIEWVMQPMGVRGVSVGTLRDGKIAANRDYWNGAELQIPNT